MWAEKLEDLEAVLVQLENDYANINTEQYDDDELFTAKQKKQIEASVLMDSITEITYNIEIAKLLANPVNKPTPNSAIIYSLRENTDLLKQLLLFFEKIVFVVPDSKQPEDFARSTLFPDRYSIHQLMQLKHQELLEIIPYSNIILEHSKFGNEIDTLDLPVVKDHNLNFRIEQCRLAAKEHECGFVNLSDIDVEFNSHSHLVKSADRNNIYDFTKGSSESNAIYSNLVGLYLTSKRKTWPFFNIIDIDSRLNNRRPALVRKEINEIISRAVVDKNDENEPFSWFQDFTTRRSLLDKIDDCIHPQPPIAIPILKIEGLSLKKGMKLPDSRDTFQNKNTGNEGFLDDLIM